MAGTPARGPTSERAATATPASGPGQRGQPRLTSLRPLRPPVPGSAAPSAPPPLVDKLRSAASQPGLPLAQRQRRRRATGSPPRQSSFRLAHLPPPPPFCPPRPGEATYREGEAGKSSRDASSQFSRPLHKEREGPQLPACLAPAAFVRGHGRLAAGEAGSGS